MTPGAIDRPAGATGRLAVPVTGAEPTAKRLVLGLVDDTGFDPVDAGSVEDAWRMQAGTPAYCTELDAGHLRRALAIADHDAAVGRRQAILTILESWEPDASIFEHIVALNRAAAGTHRLFDRPE